MSCNPDEVVDPVIPNEEEVITTLNLTLTSDSGAVVVFSFQDLDGDGGNAPIQSGDTLQNNTTYSAVLELLNETETASGGHYCRDRCGRRRSSVLF